MALPLDDERHTNAAFPGVALAAAQREVARAVRSELRRRTAVVGQEEDDRVLFEIQLAQFRQHRADRVVELARHREVGAPLLILDAVELGPRLLRRLHRRVYGIEREIEEERIRLVALDERGRLLRE